VRKLRGSRQAEIPLLWEAVSAALLVAGYCWLQLRSLLVPGVCGDEAYDGAQAQQIIRAGLRHIGAWPLFTAGYHGALQAYLLIPFFLLIKEPFVAIRTSEVVFSLIVIAAAYLCARRFFNPIAALFMLVLLLANPTFIYRSRLSISEAGIMAAFYLGALIFLQAWGRSGKNRHLYVAAFLAGAGFCLRLWFYWFYAGLLLAAFIFRAEVMRTLRRRPIAPQLGGAAAFFILGLTLYILKEAAGRGTELFSYGLAHLHYGVRGADNFMILRNLGTRFHQFMAELYGHILGGFPSYPPGEAALLNQGASIFYGTLLALSIFFLVALGRGAYRRKAIFFIALLLGMFLPSIFTLSNFVQDHLFILFPIPQIIMGAAAYLLFERVMQRERLWKAACLGLAFYAAAPAFHLWEFSRIERFMRRTGGTWYYSDANVDMVHWLEKDGYFAPKNCDIRLDAAMHLLSNEKINAISCWQPSYGAPNRQDAAAFFKRCTGGENIYLFLSPNPKHPNYSTFPYFSSLLNRTGEKFVVRKVFDAKNGEPAYTIYSLSKPDSIEKPL